MYSTVLFDLDGTLTDPALGITNSVMYALKKYGITVQDRSELYKFIGPPLVDSFMEYYGFSKEKAMEAVSFYREYFSVKGLYENTVYEGTREMLHTLKQAGKRLIIASSKPEGFVKEILRHFGLEEYFDFVAGATMDETRCTKDAVIAYALEKCPYIEKSTAIMVGDREHDVFGARAHGLPCIGVLYGFGGRQELERAQATYIAQTTKDVVSFIM